MLELRPVAGATRLQLTERALRRGSVGGRLCATKQVVSSEDSSRMNGSQPRHRMGQTTATLCQSPSPGTGSLKSVLRQSTRVIHENSSETVSNAPHGPRENRVIYRRVPAFFFFPAGFHMRPIPSSRRNVQSSLASAQRPFQHDGTASSNKSL